MWSDIGYMAGVKTLLGDHSRHTCLRGTRARYSTLEALCNAAINLLPTYLLNKKHLKNVGPIRHNEPPHAHSADVASGTDRAPPAHRCPRHRHRQRRRQRQRVTEGTAMAPWNGPNKLEFSNTHPRLITVYRQLACR